MSEAELHIIRQRMLQGAQQKARRGELVTRVPMGYMRDDHGRVPGRSSSGDAIPNCLVAIRSIFSTCNALCQGGDIRHGSMTGVSG